MLLSTVFGLFLAGGFAMFFLANAGSFVLAVALLSLAETLLTLRPDGFLDGGLLNGALAIAAMQFGYFAALAFTASRARPAGPLSIADGEA